MALIMVSGSGVAAEVKEKLMPSELFLIAYESMTMGDWLAEQDMADDAVNLYKEARDLFQEIASDYPLWQTRLVKFRIKYCDDRLKRLRATADAEPLVREITAKPGDSMGAPDKASDETVYSGIIRTAARLEQVGDLKSALEIYSVILEKQPGHVEALKGAVRCYLRMDLVDKAGALLQQEITKPVSDADLHLLMAIVECCYQQFDRAILLVRLALEDKPVNAEAHIVLGVAMLRTGNIKAARKEMKRALSLNSKLSEAYYNLTWISLKTDPANIPVARAHYQNALRYGGAPDPVLDKLLQ